MTTAHIQISPQALQGVVLSKRGGAGDVHQALACFAQETYGIAAVRLNTGFFKAVQWGYLCSIVNLLRSTADMQPSGVDFHCSLTQLLDEHLRLALAVVAPANDLAFGQAFPNLFQHGAGGAQHRSEDA